MLSETGQRVSDPRSWTLNADDLTEGIAKLLSSCNTRDWMCSTSEPALPLGMVMENSNGSRPSLIGRDTSAVPTIFQEP